MTEPNDSATALAVEDLRSGYGETEIIRGVSFRIGRGDTYALVGKNGAGKTTLVKTILGLLPPMSGKIVLLGKDVTGRPAYRIAGRTVGYAPQESAVFPDLTVEENLRLGATRLPKGDFAQRCEHVFTLFPFLAQRLRQRAGTLSGGEQKMLLVSRALLPKPDIVVLDEVSEGLQPSVVDRIRDALAAEQKASGLTILVVEQNIRFVLQLASRYALVARGGISREGRMTDDGVRDLIESHLSI
jgi:ABC-type branched-subunit amino acid transport system ATPase component